MTKNLQYAFLSGLCASAASTFGKLCGLPTLQEYLILRIILFGCMITSNAVVWTYFVKALQFSGSLTATVISSSTNYSFSAVAGYVLFGEMTSVFWWSGMFFIVVGLLLVLSDGADVVEKGEKKTT